MKTNQVERRQIEAKRMLNGLMRLNPPSQAEGLDVSLEGIVNEYILKRDQKDL